MFVFFVANSLLCNSSTVCVGTSSTSVVNVEPLGVESFTSSHLLYHGSVKNTPNNCKHLF